MKILFWSSLAFVVYIYQGYLWLLRVLHLLLVKARSAINEYEMAELPIVTVLLTVCNEELKVERRIRNILDCDYPRDKLEILVASDGSTDRTEEIIMHLGQSFPVQLFCSGGRFGKTETQNRAIPAAQGEIIIFTDADTAFSREFLREIVQPFASTDVGMVTAHLLFSSVGTSVSDSQGYYWNYELQLRQYESDMGILAVGSGQCMAARKALIRPMETFVGEDCLIPLDVALQGYRVIHQKTAIAFDQMEAQPEREFRTRVRMTLRNWLGTWRRYPLINPMSHPGYAFSLMSHKILRWLSPFFLIVCSVSLCIIRDDSFYRWLFAGMVIFYLFAALGWLGEKMGKSIPVASQGFGFLLANAGFLIGLLKAWSGSRIVIYRSGELEQQKHEPDNASN